MQPIPGISISTGPRTHSTECTRFYMWYWGAHALDHLGDVIWVGANRKAVERMGFRSASTMRDALEMASGTVGRDPSITYLHSPPHALADVK